MSFLEEIEEMKKERESEEDVVISEIINWFSDMINNKYEEYLKKRIKDKIEKNENKLTLNIEYTSYSCSDKKQFYCSGFSFSREGYDYKGIRFYDIQVKVCDKIRDILVEKLESLGLTIINEERKDNRFNEYRKEITISW